MELFLVYGNSMVSQFAALELVDWIIRKQVKWIGIVKLSTFYIGPPILPCAYFSMVTENTQTNVVSLLY